MKTLAAFQLLVGLGVLLSVWALGPFAISTRSVVVAVLIAVVVLIGPTLLLLGSTLLFFSKTRGLGGTIELVGSVFSTAWLIYIVANIVIGVIGQLHRPLSKWVVEVAFVISLVIVTSSAAAIRLYRITHGERHPRSTESQGHRNP
jgi:hypothetical protein